MALATRIDVHSHFLPPFYSQALVETGHSKPDGMPGIPPWSVESHLDLMAQANVSKSILSISSPGIALWDDAAKCAQMARDVNSFAANLSATYPDKFGFWASLPLPYVQESLAEIDVALSEGASGFGLLSNYRGHYVGDAIFDEIFKALDERNATIFIHPTLPCTACSSDDESCPWDGIPAAPLSITYPSPVFEFLFDTARVVTNLLLQAAYTRFPSITTIFPHVGGAITPLLTRFTTFASVVPAAFDGTTVVGITEAEARAVFNSRCYFDLAGWPFPGQLRAFLEGTGVGLDRLLYGSDFPFTSAVAVPDMAKTMDAGLQDIFGWDVREKVYVENAQRLLDNGKHLCRH